MRTFLARLSPRFRQTGGDYWSDRFVREAEQNPAAGYWLANPLVHAHFQQRAMGGVFPQYGTWVEYCLGEFLGGRLPLAQMLSLGCGTGELERGLHRLGAFRHCDAWDIAPGAIQLARDSAAAAGIETIAYAVQDISSADFPAAHYDAVWFNMALHHIEALERTCEGVARSLKPDGLLFLSEYVGANRFTISRHQKRAIRRTFDLIPRQYRRRAAPHTGYKDFLIFPIPWRLRQIDPSEAVRSADIMKVLPTYFEIVCYRPTSGTLLQFLLQGIAHNFTAADPNALKILEMLFTIEDTLVDSGELSSDFAFIVARPKQRLASGDQERAATSDRPSSKLLVPRRPIVW